MEPIELATGHPEYSNISGEGMILKGKCHLGYRMWFAPLAQLYPMYQNLGSRSTSPLRVCRSKEPPTTSGKSALVRPPECGMLPALIDQPQPHSCMLLEQNLDKGCQHSQKAQGLLLQLEAGEPAPSWHAIGHWFDMP
jgi:hypothetical protein